MDQECDTPGLDRMGKKDGGMGDGTAISLDLMFLEILPKRVSNLG